MSFKTDNKVWYLNDGTPIVWGTQDRVAALPNLSNETKLLASDGTSSDYFGISVAAGCGRIVVGASGHDNGDPFSDEGAIYVFDLNGNEIGKLVSSDIASSDAFGYAVAIGCGVIVVGVHGDDDNGSTSGSAYIFDLSGNQLAKIKPSDGASGDLFGWSVAVGSGRIVVGAYGDDDNVTGSGSAYIFDLAGNQLAKLTANDVPAYAGFGTSVAVSNNIVVVGAPSAGAEAAYIFDLDGKLLKKIIASDSTSGYLFGSSVAVGSGKIVVGSSGYSSNSGCAYIFNLRGDELKQLIPDDPSLNAYFGNFIAIGSGMIAVGSYYDNDYGSLSGSVYLYDLNGKALTKLFPNDPGSGDRFGTSVSIGSGRLVVGSPYNDDGASNRGSSYVWTAPEIYTIYDAIEYQKGNK